jgi:gluconate 2-dehydrogenase alpha chain
VQDWGVTYEDLEPHYWRAEQMMGVGGRAGNLRGKIMQGGNPFEGRARTNILFRRSRPRISVR